MRVCQKSKTHPLFCCFIVFLHRFSSSDYAELTEHSCFTDYARNLNGFGLTAIGLAHSHSSFRGYRHDRQVEFPFKIRE